MSTTNDKQIGGTHYKSSHECWDYIVANNLGYLEGTAIKYLTRWRKKNGIEDLRKAIHFIEKLIEVELANTQSINLELFSNMAGMAYSEGSNGTLGGFRRVCDVGEQVGDSHTVWPGELNDTIVIREDDVQS